MFKHTCPWWGGYFIDNRLRRLLHNPEAILAAYVQPGMTVMDFGCGMGFFSIPMARMTGCHGRVIAVDVQPQMLNTLRKRAERAGVADRIRTHRCEPDSIGVAEPVDFVLAFWAAHESRDFRRLVTEVGASLRPGGKFLLVEPRFHVSGKAFQRMLRTAAEVGLEVSDEPRIRWSRVALLAEPQAVSASCGPRMPVP